MNQAESSLADGNEWKMKDLNRQKEMATKKLYPTKVRLIIARSLLLGEVRGLSGRLPT